MHKERKVASNMAISLADSHLDQIGEQLTQSEYSAYLSHIIDHMRKELSESLKVAEGEYESTKSRLNDFEGFISSIHTGNNTKKTY